MFGCMRAALQEQMPLSAPGTLLFRRRRSLRNHDSRNRVQVAASPVPTGQSSSAQPKAAAALRPGRHSDRHRTVRRVDLELVPEDRLPGRKRQLHFEVVADSSITRMRDQTDSQIEVAGWTATDTTFAFAGEPKHRVITDAERDVYVETAAVQRDPAAAASQQLL